CARGRSRAIVPTSQASPRPRPNRNGAGPERDRRGGQFMTIFVRQRWAGWFAVLGGALAAALAVPCARAEPLVSGFQPGVRPGSGPGGRSATAFVVIGTARERPAVPRAARPVPATKTLRQALAERFGPAGLNLLAGYYGRAPAGREWGRARPPPPGPPGPRGGGWAPPPAGPPPPGGGRPRRRPRRRRRPPRRPRRPRRTPRRLRPRPPIRRSRGRCSWASW